MLNEINPSALEVNCRGDWHGRLIAHDGVPATDFEEDDIQEVLASAKRGDQWDGTEAALLRLNDGRFVSYESFYGPTGSGFSEDAYGGNADIHFGATLESVIRWGLTDEGRNILGIEQPGRDSGDE